MNRLVKHPCQGCVYFSVCGENTRTQPCEGRRTKTDIKNERKESNGKR